VFFRACEPSKHSEAVFSNVLELEQLPEPVNEKSPVDQFAGKGRLCLYRSNQVSRFFGGLGSWRRSNFSIRE